MALQVGSHWVILFILELVQSLRIYFSAGVKALRDVGVKVVSVDPAGDPECAGESAALTRWHFQELKSPTKRKPEVELVLHGSDEVG